MTNSSNKRSSRTPRSLNRRQLLRYAAAASAAAAITGRAKARAEIALRRLTFDKQDPSHPDTPEGLRCKRAIALLRKKSLTEPGDGMTVQQWIYGRLGANMAWFMENAQTYDDGTSTPTTPDQIDMLDLHDRLDALSQLINDPSSPVYNFSLRDYFLQSTPFTNPPVPANVTSAFNHISEICALPHVNTRNPLRPLAAELLSDQAFQEKVGPIEAYKMYQVDRNTHLGYDADRATYLLAREGFRLGIFTERTGQVIHRVEDNDKCWSDIDGCRSEPNRYCDTDINNEPTTSSDTCP